jgi:hypothetical protein
METNWTDEAEKAIEAAKRINNPFAKKQMLVIAEAYMKLAKYARAPAELKMKSEPRLN